MSTRDTAWPDGTPCWVDHLAPDVAAAQAFYADLFGWTYDDADPQYGGYLTCRRDGRAAAGMSPAGDQPARWTTCFATSDAAAAADRVVAAGGALLNPPMQVGPLGTMVVAADPQGHPFTLWQAGAFIGAEVVNEPGGLVWNEAAVADPEAARAFYGTVLGWRFHPVEGAADYTTFGTTERPLGGLGGTPPGEQPSGWTACFSVESADEAVAVVEKAGGTVSTPPTDMPFGRYAVVADPWGAVFSVMQEPPA